MAEGAKPAANRSRRAKKQSVPKSQRRSKKSISPAPAVTVEPGANQVALFIVGVGASAGGLEALQELLDNMPVDLGVALVVVTHQHPSHVSLLPELLAKHTAMPVSELAEGIVLAPNHVYVGPPGGYLALLHGTIHRMETGSEQSPRLPIDYFFRSLADDQKERAIGIVLSGTGADGTLGVKAIKDESGMVMVQLPDSAKYPGMPNSAIATGLADHVLAPAAMPTELARHVGTIHRTVRSTRSQPSVIPNEVLKKIFVILRARTGQDFSNYKTSTIRRRIERRMDVHQIATPSQYVRFLQEDSQEVDVLFKELLIRVTSFFRDPQAFEALAAGPLVQLLESREEDSTVRAWVPGCACGEEALSLTIVLRECAAKIGKHYHFQLFGTDLDSEAIDAARAGLYPASIAADVSAERLERYFRREDAGYRIRKEIRDMVVFAPQNVISDPPFTRLDVISCRNLLIYLDDDVQQRVLSNFHYALNPGGLLFLGPSETIGRSTDDFETVDVKWRIFRCMQNGPAAGGRVHVLFGGGREDAESPVELTMPKFGKDLRVSKLLERALLDQLCPASVVVNERGEILHVHGRTGAYLELSRGRAELSVIDMAREGLAHELAGALRAAAKENKEVVRDNVRVKTNGGETWVNVSVNRILDPKPIRGLLIVTFRPAGPAPAKASRQAKARGRAESDLAHQLRQMKDSHQTVLHELETANEELKGTNEEMQSTNEELQSLNEELETSKEEMQSLNEELTTVNTELQSKIDDLSQVNDDMQNLLNSTEIATVFLDNDLNIKRFTEQARNVVAVRDLDMGRPMSELATKLKCGNLLHECREVLRTLVHWEAEVEANDGTWYLARIMPYRTSKNVIDGLVVTFVKIDTLREAKKAEALARDNLSSIVESIREPLMVLDESLHVAFCNRSFYSTFQTDAKLTEGKLIYELGTGQWDIVPLRKLLEEILPREEAIDAFRVEADFPKIGHRTFVLNGRRLKREPGLPPMILLAMEETGSEG